MSCEINERCRHALNKYPRKLASLEKKYDIQFKAVFDAIRELMTPLVHKKKRPIGLAPWKEK